MTGDDVRGWEWVVTMVVPAGWECPGLSHCILQLDDRMDLNKYKSIGPWIQVCHWPRKWVTGAVADHVYALEIQILYLRRGHKNKVLCPLPQSVMLFVSDPAPLWPSVTLVPLEARDVWKNITHPRSAQDQLHHPWHRRAPGWGWDRALGGWTVAETHPGTCAGGYRRGDTGYTQINMPQPTCANLPSFAEKQAKELSEHHSLSHVQDFWVGPLSHLSFACGPWFWFSFCGRKR